MNFNKSTSTVQDVSMAGASSVTKLVNAVASATISNTAQALPLKRFELTRGAFLVLANHVLWGLNGITSHST